MSVCVSVSVCVCVCVCMCYVCDMCVCVWCVLCVCEREGQTLKRQKGFSGLNSTGGVLLL